MVRATCLRLENTEVRKERLEGWIKHELFSIDITYSVDFSGHRSDRVTELSDSSYLSGMEYLSYRTSYDDIRTF